MKGCRTSQGVAVTKGRQGVQNWAEQIWAERIADDINFSCTIYFTKRLRGLSQNGGARERDCEFHYCSYCFCFDEYVCLLWRQITPTRHYPFIRSQILAEYFDFLFGLICSVCVLPTVLHKSIYLFLNTHLGISRLIIISPTLVFIELSRARSAMVSFHKY